MLRFAVALLAVSLVAAPARAEVVTVQFTSTVTYVQNQPVLGITTTIGAPVSGEFTYDRSAVDSDPGDSTRGIYGGVSVGLVLDGHTIAGQAPLVVVFDIPGSNDLFSVAAGTPQTGVPIVIDGAAQPDGYTALGFTEFSGATLTSDALPTPAQVLAMAISQFNLVEMATNGVILFDDVTITNILTDALAITSITDVRNDQGRQVRVRFDASSYDQQGSPTPILQYEAFRRIDAFAGPAHATPPGLEQRLATARRLGMMSDASLLTEWEFVHAIPAHGQADYSMVVPTLADSTPDEGIVWSAFFVRAATADPYTYWDTPIDSGYSVDNLAPNVPQGFVVVERLPNDDLVLEWSGSPDADFRYYALHRGTTAGFLPSVANRIASVASNGYVDAGAWAPVPHYYKLAAVDFAGNTSGFAAASTHGALGIETGRAASYRLSPVEPNPARGATFARFDLPDPARVNIAIVDVAGRTVRTLMDGRTLPAGTHRAEWDGRDGSGTRVPAGVYFYRFHANGHASVRRLAILE